MKSKQPHYFVLIIFVFCSCRSHRPLHQPVTEALDSVTPVVTKLSDTAFYAGNNTLLKNKQGQWELYVEGDPLQRGLRTGALTETLLQKQEHIFFDKVETWVPSKLKQKLLRSFLNVYNRKLCFYVPEEYKTEIFGLSRYSSHDFDKLAPRYLRAMYLHAAHDIGHALQDLAIVGCSSFAAWGDRSEDGSLILGRNFDFYVDDDFAREKVVAFVSPKRGNKFMMVTWPGMAGAVSGMNSEGLTVTINAGKSKVPLMAKTPISIVAREILQYAKNVNDAIAIARKRKVFVSESIMIGSANDKKAIIIEVTPNDFGVYSMPNNNELICSNHFQSDELKDGKRNKYQIANSHSQYRYDRMVQLLDQSKKLNPQKAAAILRNREGLNGRRLGYGNEKALDQLRAHHAVIFKPEQRLVWVSSNPYQLGEFVCYDLNKIFGNRTFKDSVVTLQRAEMNIPKDPFLNSAEFASYERFKVEDKKMDDFIDNMKGMDSAFAKNYQSLDSDYWEVYYKVGLYYYKNKKYALAKENFQKALTKEITTFLEKQKIEKYLKKIDQNGS